MSHLAAWQMQCMQLELRAPQVRYMGGFFLAIWLSRKSDGDKKAALQEALKLLQDGVFTPQAGMPSCVAL